MNLFAGGITWVGDAASVFAVEMEAERNRQRYEREYREALYGGPAPPLPPKPAPRPWDLRRELDIDWGEK